MPLVARLAERFGLPGNTPDSVDAARDKHATRAKMSVRPLSPWLPQRARCHQVRMPDRQHNSIYAARDKHAMRAKMLVRATRSHSAGWG